MQPALISPEVCVTCKGRLRCGLSHCPLLLKSRSRAQMKPLLKNHSFTGSSPPGIFVSWKNHPKVTIAPLSPVYLDSNAGQLDAPEQWYGLPMDSILSFREQLVRSTTPVHITEAPRPTRTVSMIQELALSSKPVTVGVQLSRLPSFDVSFSDTVAPMGPSASMRSMTLEDSPKVDRKVDSIVSDTDLKATFGMQQLYKKNFPMPMLHKLLSAGLLGIQKQRTFVPTRYAITAADSTISQSITHTLHSRPELNEFEVYRSHYLGNYFHILLLPGPWGFEQIEAWYPGSSWVAKGGKIQMSQDHEWVNGRTRYAENVAGGYYAGRLAVTEHLHHRRRQGSAIVFREVTNQYPFSLGVWVVRESMRAALRNSPDTFSSLAESLSHIGTRLKIPLRQWMHQSKLLDYHLHQKRLSEF